MVKYRGLKIQNQYETVVRTVDFKDRLGGRNWAKIGKNTFLLESEEGRIDLFELVDQAIYDVHFFDALPEGAPFQLLNGKLIFMATPKEIHQKLAFRLTLRIGNLVELNRLGEVRFAPYAVRLNVKNVPQPDLLFISTARTHLIKEDGLHGAPDLAVEIASRSTRKIDRTIKKDLYAQHGTREYWIVNPDKKTVDFYENIGGELVLTATLGEKDTLRSTVLQGFELPMNELF